MSDRNTVMRHYLDSLVAKKVEVQILLRGSAAMVGPAIIVAVPLDNGLEERTECGLYSMTQKATFQENVNARAKTVQLSTSFHVDDVVSVVRVSDDNVPAIIGRSGGGLHLGG